MEYPIALMVIEDDKTLLEVVEILLVHKGFVVLTARSEEEAVVAAFAYGGRLSLIIADVMLGSGRGTNAVRRIRLQRPGVGVIFMSGYTRETCLKPEDLQPGDSYIAKPFRLSLLKQRVIETLDSVHLRPKGVLNRPLQGT